MPISPPGDPLGEAEAVGADCVQVFLSDPQGWGKPPPREAAADVGAAAVIVHPGHAGDEIAEGIGRWVRTLDMLESEVPLYIENTAGGEKAVARRFDDLARLWEGIAGADSGIELGFCFDTCHAHAAGEELDDAVDRVRAACGRIDLLHANDSRDPPGTGADRHANLGRGEIGAERLQAMISSCGSPVVVETPGNSAELRTDIEFAREAVGASTRTRSKR